VFVPFVLTETCSGATLLAFADGRHARREDDALDTGVASGGEDVERSFDGRGHDVALGVLRPCLGDGHRLEDTIDALHLGREHVGACDVEMDDLRAEQAQRLASACVGPPAHPGAHVISASDEIPDEGKSEVAVGFGDEHLRAHG
jgi:hypothetical protein